MPIKFGEPREHPIPRISVEAARAGHPEALAVLYAQYAPDLLRLAFRLTGTVEDAEDVLQDVFVGLPEALRHYEERGNLRAWLRQVTARTALMLRRRTAVRREVSLDGSTPATAAMEPTLEQVALQRALEGLPGSLRAVFVLKVMEGYSHAEVAALLGIRRGTSEVRLYRAIRLLRSALRTTIP